MGERLQGSSVAFWRGHVGSNTDHPVEIQPANRCARQYDRCTQTSRIVSHVAAAEHLAPLALAVCALFVAHDAKKRTDDAADLMDWSLRVTSRRCANRPSSREGPVG